MSFSQILTKYRKISHSERDKGDRFERLMQAYLQTDPKYAYRFKHVWMWNEFPGKLDLGGHYTGIIILRKDKRLMIIHENEILDKSHKHF